MNIVKYLFVIFTLIYFFGCNEPCCEQESLSLAPLATKTPPEAVIKGIYDQNITVGDSIAINGDLSVDDGNITDYIWTINGNQLNNNKKNIVYTFNKVGINQICLKVIDNDNIPDETCRYISVQPKPQTLPPLAKLPVPVISIDGVTDNRLDSSKRYILDCNNSYDQDSIDSDNAYVMGLNGDIIKCLWTVDGYNYQNHKKPTCVKHHPDNSWSFCGHANYIEIILTVQDDENQTFTKSSKYYPY